MPHSIYIGNSYGYPGCLGEVTIASRKELTWHGLYKRVETLCPEYGFSDDQCNLHVYVLPEGLDGSVSVVCASLDTSSERKGVGMPSLPDPRKAMHNPLLCDISAGCKHMLYIYLSRPGYDFMRDRRYAENARRTAYHGTSIGEIEQSARSLHSAFTIRNSPFHDDPVSRSWSFTPLPMDISPAVDDLRGIMADEDFIDLLCMIREWPYAVPAAAEMQMHRGALEGGALSHPLRPWNRLLNRTSLRCSSAIPCVSP
jgi:hypothetical protein